MQLTIMYWYTVICNIIFFFLIHLQEIGDIQIYEITPMILALNYVTVQRLLHLHIASLISKNSHLRSFKIKLQIQQLFLYEMSTIAKQKITLKRCDTDKLYRLADWFL